MNTLKQLKQITTAEVLNLQRDLTAGRIVGLPETERYDYNPNELHEIKLELLSFAACKNENYSAETVNAWINEFSMLNMKPAEVVKRIRMAKLERKFGATEFAVFMNADIRYYYEYYKPKKNNSGGIEDL